MTQLVGVSCSYINATGTVTANILSLPAGIIEAQQGGVFAQTNASNDLVFYTNTSGDITLSGQIICQHPVSLQFTGTPTLYNSSQTSLGSTTSTGNWYFPKWSSYNSKNWTPSYSNTTQLQIPFDGLYFIQFCLGTTTTASGEIVINPRTPLNRRFLHLATATTTSS